MQIDLPELKDGEIYAGITLNEDGTPKDHVILLPGDNDDDTHKNQLAWAAEQGGDLPTRQEQSLLFANCKNHFKGEWYWSNERHASGSDCAWPQYFNNGRQNCYNVYDDYRARAVRRLSVI